MASTLTGGIDEVGSMLKDSILKATRWNFEKRYNLQYFPNGSEQLEFVFRKLPESFAKDLLVSFKGIIYGNLVKTENLHYVPDGRWAYFKTAVFPEWLLKIFPAKTKIIAQEITVYNSYPSIPYSGKDSYRYYEKFD